MELDVRVIPRAARDELAGMRDGRLLVRVTAPPLEGRANAAVCALLAKAAGVPKGAVAVVRGEGSRDKRVRIGGDVDEAAVRARLGLA
ncbi:MAG: DUF167 domain-containing protein [Actinobacteria bacterium]|nr:DUF167 domain-containing protein [Actinomycetota bacterium]